MRVTLLICAVLIIALAGGAFTQEITLIKGDSAARIAYTNPVFSPNGQSIAFVSIPYSTSPDEDTFPKTGKSIHLATPSAGVWKSRVLVKNADWPVWSPDGKRLAFNQGGLAVMDIASGKITQLTKDKVGASLDDSTISYPLSWSPNGQYILCSIADGEGINTSLVDSKTARVLPNLVGDESFWMPDGRLLSMVHSTHTRVVNPIQFRIVDIAKGVSQPLLDDFNVRRPFVPRGAGFAWIWLGSDAPKGEGLYKLNLKTKVLGKEIGVRAEQVYWAPNAKQFAFIGRFAQKKGDETKTYLYIGNTTNWGFKIAARGVVSPTGNWPDRMRYACWSPTSTSIAFPTEDGGINILKL